MKDKNEILKMLQELSELLTPKEFKTMWDLQSRYFDIYQWKNVLMTLQYARERMQYKLQKPPPLPDKPEEMTPQDRYYTREVERLVPNSEQTGRPRMRWTS